jgi:predicted TIM-barrel fold metal-dependent hydrolase
MAKTLPPIIDGDGHVFEDVNAIYELMGEPYRGERRGLINASPFPQGDHIHLPAGRTPPGSFDMSVGPKEWLAFAKDVGVTAAVVYPSLGLAYGRIQNLTWAKVVCRAYNDWLARTYCTEGSPLRGMALVPLQDPQAAAAELRRAVKELGLLGAVLPPTGLRNYLGDPEYWPLFEAANELGCPVAVHGGAFPNLGLDNMRSHAAVNAIGHPMSMLTNFASMTFNGTFERFPKVRFAFLEAGCSWLLICLERLGASAYAFQDWDGADARQPLYGDALTEMLLGLLRDGRIYVGVEGEEISLPAAIKIVGSARPFVFSSDYPHEVNADLLRHEVEELLENDDISQGDKEAILFHNAAELYGIKSLSRA